MSNMAWDTPELPGAPAEAVSEGRAYAPFRPTWLAGAPKNHLPPQRGHPVSDTYHTIFFNHTHVLVHKIVLVAPWPGPVVSVRPACGR